MKTALRSTDQNDHDTKMRAFKAGNFYQDFKGTVPYGGCPLQVAGRPPRRPKRLRTHRYDLCWPASLEESSKFPNLALIYGDYLLKYVLSNLMHIFQVFARRYCPDSCRGPVPQGDAVETSGKDGRRLD